MAIVAAARSPSDIEGRPFATAALDFSGSKSIRGPGLAALAEAANAAMTLDRRNLESGMVCS
ncbi:MAG: hypothetical protein U1F35_18660 [Steroidobacteraceae bacterium]